jgi:hypothetical protein
MIMEKLEAKELAKNLLDNQEHEEINIVLNLVTIKVIEKSISRKTTACTK